MLLSRALLKRHSVLPGFDLALGFTLLYLSFIVLIPLSAAFLKTFTMSWPAFWDAVTAPRVFASYRLTFGASFAAALVNAVFGLVVCWVLVRYDFPGRRVVDALVDLPFALPTAVAGIALTALYSGNGWIGQWLPFKVREMQHVAPGKTEAVHSDKAIGQLQALIGPGERGVESERQPALLQRRIHFHVGVRVVARVVRRRHHEADDTRPFAELLDELIARLRIVERQVEHRLDAWLLVEDGVAEPAIVAAREPDLDIVPRAVGKVEHRRREHHRHVDAELVHPALHQHDVAMRFWRHLLVLALRIARDAAGEFLVGTGLRRDAATRGALEFRLVAQHRIVDELGDLLERLGLVVVRLDVDDEEVFIAALDRLLGGVAATGCACRRPWRRDRGSFACARPCRIALL